MKRYFMGDVTDRELTTTVEILIVAENEEEAKARYDECVDRHSELEKKESPKIAEFWGDWDLVNRSITEDDQAELDAHFSVPVYI